MINGRYLTFVASALLGANPTKVDQLYKKYESEILETAESLRKQFDYKPTKLYRGILLEDEQVFDGKVLPIDHIKYLSFTEDRAVAKDFADPDSLMSAVVVAMRPSVKGYIIEHVPNQDEVLFHWSWFYELPLLHNIYVLDPMVILKQKETILKQSGHQFNLIAYDE